MQRDLGSFRSIRVNNFFFFVALLVAGAMQSGLPPWSAYPFMALMGLLLLFPLSSDPLDKIPRERLALWPIDTWTRFALRLTSLALSPILWIAILFALKKSTSTMALSFIALAIVVRGIAFVGLRVPRVPNLPLLPGRLGGMITHHAREMFCLLDTYIAVSLSVLGAVYRIFGTHPDPAAFPVLAILVSLALSTSAQSLFGLDFDSGTTLCRLLPVRGWEVLFAKDIAFLGILFLLVLPLAPLPGMVSGMAALAIDHHSSVFLRLPLQRWRFAGGRLLPVGALQAIAVVAFGSAAQSSPARMLAITSAGFVLSVYFYGKRWEISARRD